MIRLYGIGSIATACWASLWKSNPRACERRRCLFWWYRGGSEPRWIALAIIALLLPFINPRLEVIQGNRI